MGWKWGSYLLVGVPNYVLDILRVGVEDADALVLLLLIHCREKTVTGRLGGTPLHHPPFSQPLGGCSPSLPGSPLTFPDPDALVPAAGGKQGAGGSPGHRLHLILMSLQGGDALGRERRGEERGAGWGRGEGGVAPKLGSHLEAVFSPLPDAGGGVKAGGGQVGAAGGPGHPAHRALVPLAQHRPAGPALPWGEPHGAHPGGQAPPLPQAPPTLTLRTHPLPTAPPSLPLSPSLQPIGPAPSPHPCLLLLLSPAHPALWPLPPSPLAPPLTIETPF